MPREIERTLRIAAAEENVEKIKTLVRMGADINAGGDTGLTALLIAIQHGASLQVISCLIERGANVNLANVQTGVTPLNMACRYNRLNVAKLLLYHGAWVNAARIKDGVTPLMIAVQNGSVELAQCLLERGASIHARKRTNGFTALHLACAWQSSMSLAPSDSYHHRETRSNRTLISLLLETAFVLGGPGGVESALSARAHDGSTPLTVAWKYGSSNLVRHILLSQNKLSNPLTTTKVRNHSSLEQVSRHTTENDREIHRWPTDPRLEPCLPVQVSSPCNLRTIALRDQEPAKKRANEAQCWMQCQNLFKCIREAPTRSTLARDSYQDGRTPLLSHIE